MNRVLVCLAFLFGPVVSAVALKKPVSLEDQEALKRIQSQINKALSMQASVSQAEIDLVQAKNEEKKTPGSLSPERLAALNQTVRQAKDRQNAEFGKAIRMTMKVYDIAPASSRGTSVLHAMKGREIEWVPVAGEPESRMVQRGDGKFASVSQPRKDLAAETYGDGVTVFYRDSFINGPGWLASNLLHESRHFEQITTPGWESKTRAEYEVDATNRVLDNKAVFFEPSSARDRGLLRSVQDYHDGYALEKRAQDAARKGLRGMLRSVLPSSDPSDIFDAAGSRSRSLADLKSSAERDKVAAAAEFEDIAQGQARADEELSRGLAGLRKAMALKNRMFDDDGKLAERERMIAPKADLPPPQAAMAAPQAQVAARPPRASINLEFAYDNARELATRACQGLALSQDQVDFTMHWFTEYLKKNAMAALGTDASCEDKIMSHLVRLASQGKSVWADWLAREADGIQHPPSPVVTGPSGGSVPSRQERSESHDFSHAHNTADRIPAIRW